MNRHQLTGYLYAKLQHARTREDIAIYRELLDDLKTFDTWQGFAQLTALIDLIRA